MVVEERDPQDHHENDVADNRNSVDVDHPLLVHSDGPVRKSGPV